MGYNVSNVYWSLADIMDRSLVSCAQASAPLAPSPSSLRNRSSRPTGDGGAPTSESEGGDEAGAGSGVCGRSSALVVPSRCAEIKGTRKALRLGMQGQDRIENMGMNGTHALSEPRGF